jgi:hypothetical protein
MRGIAVARIEREYPRLTVAVEAVDRNIEYPLSIDAAKISSPLVTALIEL